MPSTPNTSCLRPLRHTIRFAWVLALARAGSKSPINNAIIAITTSSSTNVNPFAIFCIIADLHKKPLLSDIFFPLNQLKASGGTITLYFINIPNPRLQKQRILTGPKQVLYASSDRVPLLTLQQRAFWAIKLSVKLSMNCRVCSAHQFNLRLGSYVLGLKPCDTAKC